MSKKFDVVIGNPPYQEEAGGTATHSMPVYHQFMDAAYEVGEKVVLITPARFLFNAGYTPKAWNEKMLADPHLTVPHYVPNSDELFPGTDIKGGIAVTYRDDDYNGEPIGTFTKYPELNTILHKVIESHVESIAPEITSSRSYRYTAEMHNDHPHASSIMSSGEQFKINTRTFQQLSFLYHSEDPGGNQEYVRVYGLAGRARAYRWTRSEYLTGPKSFGAHKVVVPAANGSGDLGEVLSTPVVVGPDVAVTQTFITIGCFNDQATADACLKYVKSKFARALLGILKITQHNPAKVWKYVPLQDFTSESDIDWSKPIPEIDKQLFAKYGLDADEIAFIEAQVKSM
ncbi:Eco57I restriction-modification methylase domain-containing protein [Arthrobacter sp. H14-L1]|uniref:Eco57I restriction-modification methylase domain-containing protein n=1 Tax=Arthrobacter sp. H14-L1 TaxID=2996697 RepID=UPI00227167AC|nr:Eco57I restriction-modification methylase domain-containing protein [Arthrobacter sp. H14-L1]MCY0905792.1 Eco57I restriction-modification methylase domain-containing protein [Arthrobacter sp. H14-L1]